MKMSTYATLVFALLLVLAGCTEESKQETTQGPDNSSTEKKIATPAEDQVIELLKSAQTANQEIYAKLPLSSEQMNEHFRPHFTEKFLKEQIFSNGNFVKENGLWTSPFLGSEPLAGTSILYEDNEKLYMESFDDLNDSSFAVKFNVKEGLYAAHIEKAIFVFEDSTWKIDKFKWMGDPLNDKQFTERMNSAAERASELLVKLPVTDEELLNHLVVYYTPNYIERLVKNGKGFKKVDGKWQAAVESDELLEGTFVIPPDKNTEITLRQRDEDTLIYYYTVPEGLYPEHLKLVKLVFLGDSWLIDNMTGTWND